MVLLIVGCFRLARHHVPHGSWEAAATDRQRLDALASLGIEGADAQDLARPSSSSDSLGLVGALLVDTGPQPGRSAFSPGERLLYRLSSDVALDGADGGVILERIVFPAPIPFRSNARKADGSQRRYSQ